MNEEIRKYVEKTMSKKTCRHLGCCTVEELSNFDKLQDGDCAIVIGIPYEEDGTPGTAKFGKNGLVVRNEDTIIYHKDKQEFFHIEDEVFEEHVLKRICTIDGIVVELPFSVTVKFSRFEKHKTESSLIQIIKKLTNYIREKEGANA